MPPKRSGQRTFSKHEKQAAGYPSKTKGHKTKANKGKKASVFVHNALTYIKNKEKDIIFFQKDLEGIEYMRTFATVNERVTPQRKEQNKLVDFSYRFLVFRF